MMQNSTIFGISLAACLWSLVVTSYAEDQVESISDAIVGGAAEVDLRYRYEYVDQINLDEARASTFRTRISVETLKYQNVAVKLELDNNSNVIEGSYDNATAARILEAPYSEINQVYLDYSAPADTLVRYGRQRLDLDNQRFIGGDAWHQN